MLSRFNPHRQRAALAYACIMWAFGLWATSGSGVPAVFVWWGLLSLAILPSFLLAFSYVEVTEDELAYRNFVRRHTVNRQNIRRIAVGATSLWDVSAGLSDLGYAELEDGRIVWLRAINAGNRLFRSFRAVAIRRIEALQWWLETGRISKDEG